MHVIADSAGGAWTFGGSILTFVFPMILFIVVATTLYVLYTKPESVPGHWGNGPEHSVSYTSVPGQPTPDRQSPPAPADPASPARAEMAGTTPAETAGTTETSGAAADESAGSEDGE